LYSTRSTLMRLFNSTDIELKPGESMDAFMEGGLKLIQSKSGYRFSIDAVFLAEFVSTKPGDVLVDLGTGCGVVALMLLQRRRTRYAVGLEIQPDLVDQARRNVLLNGLEGQMGVILGDIRHPPLAPGIADVVVCNPPYRRKASGRVNPDPKRALARHEIRASLDDILGAAGKLLRAKGRLAVIYPATRLTDLLVRMRGLDLEPKRLRLVHPAMALEAKRVLVEATRGGRAGIKILPPLLDQGGYSIIGNNLSG
jgi:tRNA1Val (adenine37-N6)-methyltransferase